MKQKFTLLIATSVLSMTSGMQAMAADGVLTEGIIKQFYKESLDMRDAGPSEYVSYLEENVTEDAKITMDVETSVEGVAPHKRKQTMTKAQFIEASKNGYNPENTYEQVIISIEIEPGGQKAFLKDETNAMVYADYNGPNGKIRIAVKQNALCQLTIVVNENAKPALSDTTCNIDSVVVGDEEAVEMMKVQLERRQN